MAAKYSRKFDIISQDILSPPGYIVASCEVGGIAVSDDYTKTIAPTNCSPS